MFDNPALDSTALTLLIQILNKTNLRIFVPGMPWAGSSANTAERWVSLRGSARRGDLQLCWGNDVAHRAAGCSASLKILPPHWARTCLLIVGGSHCVLRHCCS